MSKRRTVGGSLPSLAGMREEMLRSNTNTPAEETTAEYVARRLKRAMNIPSEETVAEEVARLEREEEEAKVRSLTEFYEKELRSGRSDYEAVAQALVKLEKYEKTLTAKYEEELMRKARELAEAEVKRRRDLKHTKELEAGKAHRRLKEMRGSRPSVSPPRQKI